MSFIVWFALIKRGQRDEHLRDSLGESLFVRLMK